MSRNLYIAFGDSITAGYDATDLSFTYVSQVAHFLRSKGWVERKLVIARNGWTSAQILQAAYTTPPTVWQAARIVTVMAGGNDLRSLLRRQFLPIGGGLTPQVIEKRIVAFEENMNRFCTLFQHFEVPHVVLLTVYNPIPESTLAVEAVEQLNAVTHRLAREFQCHVVDIQRCFISQESKVIHGYRTGRLEDLLASPFRRPIHPNNDGHKLIATHVQRRLQQILAKKRKL